MKKITLLKSVILVFILFLSGAFNMANAVSATATLRPTHVDISTATSESAVLMTLSGYSGNDVRYRLYNGSNQYNCWDQASQTFVTSTSYSSGPQAPGAPTTSTTFWIIYQRGNNNATIASYRDRLGTGYSSNYQTITLPSSTAITNSYTLSGTFSGLNTYDNSSKYVALAFNGSVLVSATSTTLSTGAFSIVCPTGTSINKVEIRDVNNNSITSLTGSWSTTTSLGSIPATSTPTPTILVTEVEVPTMEANVNETATETINVSGTNLTANISLSLSGTDADMFELNTGSLSQSGGTVSNSEITITYKPTAVGTHTATLTVASTGASEVTKTLTGMAVDPTNPYGLDASSPVSELNETFETPTEVGPAMPTNWKKLNIAGANSWEVKLFNSNQYAQMTAFSGTGAQKSLLISPAINIDQIVKNNVKFDWLAGYAKAGTTLKAYVMTLDGTKTEVKSIDASSPTSGYAAAFTSETLDLSAYSGVKFLVFEYTGDGTNALTTTYQLDNIIVLRNLSTDLNEIKEQQNILVYNGTIQFSAKAGESVEVFNTIGQRLVSQATIEGLNSIQVAAHGVVLVKIGTRISKVMM